MTAKPVRIQRKRTKGWRMPENTVCVTRGTKWGNPFVVHSDRGPSGRRFPMTPEASVASFKAMLKSAGAWWPIPLPWPKGKIPAGDPTTVEDVVRELRGKNLACFCTLDQPCHADVLLELANTDAQPALAGTQNLPPKYAHGKNRSEHAGSSG